MSVAERDPPGSRLRVAIVGAGPKGLFALERLLDHAHGAGPRPALQIDLFEPHPAPGAGPVYDPGQPPFLRMNFAADRLDMWWPSTRAVPRAERLSFVQWRGAEGADLYPPRAHVGRYLADGFERLRRHAPPGTSVGLVRSAVRCACRRGSAWEVVAADGSIRAYDEILLAVGHRDGAARRAPWPHAAPLVPAVFPVTRWLSRERVAPAATVAVRGFALTFIDAALALTEGRGGAFESGGHPYRLRYIPSALDAGPILPFSRSGRPMLAKPDPRLAAGVPALAAIAEAGSARIRALGDGDVLGDLLAILASTAAGSLLAATGRPPGGDPLRRETRAATRWLVAARDGVSPSVGLGPAAELERSLAVGAGLHRPDVQWALGHTWRSVYPALVDRLGGGGLAADAWPAFGRLAAQLERLSFGPPPVNAAKLLALIAAQRVDLTHVCAGRIVTRGEVTAIAGEHGERAVDVVVDAVLPAPGAPPSDRGLVARLVAGGHARIHAGRRGLEVAPDASCVGAGGERTPGLSAIGRMTEDCVIGNDTLSRSLHPHADRWGRRVALRSMQQPVVPALGAAP